MIRRNQRPRWLLLILLVASMMFLSIGFFIFTTSSAKPTSLKLFEPKETDNAELKSNTNPANNLTILLGKNDAVYYYEGELASDGSNLKSCDLKAIRNVIVNKKATTNENELLVIIKPANEATYKNTVDILDEMTINNVKRYSMVDISSTEAELIQKK